MGESSDMLERLRPHREINPNKKPDAGPFPPSVLPDPTPKEGKLVDASGLFGAQTAETLTGASVATPASTVESPTRTKVEEEIEKVLEEQEQTQTGETGGDGTGSGSGEKPPKKPGFKKKLAAWVSAGVVTLGSIVGGGIVISKARNGGEGESQPGNTTSRTETIKTEAFNNAANKVTIKPGVNTAIISQEQIDEIINQAQPPVEKDTLPTLRMTVPPGAKEISKIYRDNQLNPLTQKYESLEFGRKVVFEKKGSPIPIPTIAGVEEVDLFRKASYEDVENNLLSSPDFYPVGFYLQFRVKGQENIIYSLNIDGVDDRQDISQNEIIKGAPIIGYKDNDPTKLKGLTISANKLQNILTTSRDNVTVSYFSVGTPPEYPKGLATKIDFITNSSGQGLSSPTV